MEKFVSMRSVDISDRQINTLIGLCKGLIADDHINQSEAEFLHNWLIQNSQVSQNQIIHNLLNKIGEVLEDGVFHEDEASQLLALLKSISGESSEFGELLKPSNLPLSQPKPDVYFKDKTFIFTGTFNFGSRKSCEEAIIDRGGFVSKNITRTVDYLVIGSYVTNSWKYETFGRKIEKAAEYEASGLSIKIIDEFHWVNFLNLKT